jgi:hypothetical protein
MDSPTSSANRDEHVRRLLSQRAARADHSGWAASSSDMSDSPSVYSHVQFSPAPRTYPASTQPQSSLLSTATDYRRHTHSPPASPLSDRERLADPALSGLDLSDPRFSYMSRDSSGGNDEDDHEDGRRPGRESTVSISANANSDELATHMSFLGPKMKIHTPAPWELDEDTEVESDGSTQTRTTTHSQVSKGKIRADGFMKGLGLAVARVSTDTRPSSDSSRSGSDSQGKASFDTISSGGALQSVLFTLCLLW